MTKQEIKQGIVQATRILHRINSFFWDKYGLYWNGDVSIPDEERSFADLAEEFAVKWGSLEYTLENMMNEIKRVNFR